MTLPALLARTHMVPRFVFGAGATLLPRLLTGFQVVPFAQDFHRGMLASVGLAGAKPADVAAGMRTLVNRDPEGVLRSIFAVVSGPNGHITASEQYLTQQGVATDRSARDLHLFVSSDGEPNTPGQEDGGHFDSSLQRFGPSTNGPTQVGSENVPLNMLIDNIPGGGTKVPPDVNAAVDAAPSTGEAAAILRQSRADGNYQAVDLTKEVRGRYWLGADPTIDMIGHVSFRENGYFVSGAHAFTSPNHPLDGWRMWLYVETPTGERLFISVGAGKHPITNGDRFNSEVGAFVFANAHAKACINADIHPDLVAKLGAAEVAKGSEGASYWEVFKEAMRRGDYHLPVNEGMIVSGNAALAEVLILARAPEPNISCAVEPVHLPRLMAASAEDVAAAVAFAADRAGVRPTPEAQLPLAPTGTDPAIAEPTRTVDIGAHLPPVSGDGGGWVPTSPTQPWRAPVDPFDPYDPGPSGDGDAPLPTPDHQVDPTDPYDPEDPHDEDDPNNPKPEPEPEPEPHPEPHSAPGHEG